MVILITIVHVIVCVFLAVVVLLQSGKAADLAGAFGGMGSQTVFGPRGSATVLSKATTIAAALFMVTSMTLSILSTRSGKASPAIFQKVVPVTQQKGGAAPAAGTVPITATPIVGGKPGKPQQINVPIQQAPAPAPQNQKK
jgi:preprotein translocase subunit SecG